jgi:hypothetical protein
MYLLLQCSGDVTHIAHCNPGQLFGTDCFLENRINSRRPRTRDSVSRAFHPAMIPSYTWNTNTSTHVFTGIYWHLYVLGLLYRMTLRTEPSDRDVRTRSPASSIDLGTRYVTVCVVSLDAGRSGGKRDNDNKRYTMRRMVLYYRVERVSDI